jgi:hypothetical protein
MQKTKKWLTGLILLTLVIVALSSPAGAWDSKKYPNGIALGLSATDDRFKPAPKIDAVREWRIPRGLWGTTERSGQPLGLGSMAKYSINGTAVIDEYTNGWTVLVYNQGIVETPTFSPTNFQNMRQNDHQHMDALDMVKL